MGLAIAHQLARCGRAVRVLSRRRREAAGFVAAGMLAPHAEGLTGRLLELGQQSLNEVPQWVAAIEAESGLACGLRPCGIVVPLESQEQALAFPTASAGSLLRRQQLEREIPGIGPRWKAGLLFPQDGQIDNRRRLMRALELACARLGVRFQEGAEVLGLDQGPDGTLRGVRLRSVEAGEQMLEASQAVLCCGAWSGQLLPQLPVLPVKGQMLSLQAPSQALRRVLFGPGIYLVPREDGLVVVGATSEPEAGFAEGLTPDGQRRLQAGIAELLPEASGWPPMERWWGFRPGTPDEGPLLGPGPIPGLWLATGHYRNGVLLAAITARLTAQALNGTLAEADRRWLEAFRWDRFPAAASAGGALR
ncbi:MAG: FAD-dependent oxidoreductase [Synechococcaceae cyanobacterium]